MTISQGNSSYQRRSTKCRRIYVLIPIFTLLFFNLSILIVQASSPAITRDISTYRLENGSLVSFSLNKSLRQPSIRVSHKVMPGETLYSISRRYYNSNEFAQRIAQDNKILNPSADLKAGNSLIISNPKIIDVYTVNSGDTVFSITQQYFNREWYTSYVQYINGINNPNIDVKAGMKLLLPSAKATTAYTVQPGETLFKIVSTNFKAAAYQDLIIKYNGINPVTLKSGVDIKIPNPFYTQEAAAKKSYNYYIEIDKSRNTLTLFKNNELVRSFMVATGKSKKLTPVGTFKIANKIKDPWYSPKSIPGKDPLNPLGTRWLGLDVPNTGGTKYGIHGTNNPASIGKYASLGCIRMNNRDVQWLYDHVPVGTVVIIKD